MTRERINQDVFETSHNLDFKRIPWTDQRVLELVIEQVNLALEEAAKAIDGSSMLEYHPAEKVRALKVTP